MIIFIFWLIFLATHLIFLTFIPIFEDEALYLFLADKIFQNPAHYFFIYPENGLFPMFGYLISLVNLFFHDSFIAGRVLNILLTSTLVFWVVKVSSLFQMKKFFEFASIILLIISPIIHLNSRVALLDTSVLVFTAWYIYFAARYLQNPQLRYFIFFLISTLAAFLTKATALFGVIPVFFLIYQHYRQGTKRGIILAYLIVLIILGIIFFFFGSQISNDSGSSLITNQPSSLFLSKVKTNIWLTYHWSKVYYLPFLFLPLIFLIFYQKIRKYRFYYLMLIWLISSTIFMITLNRFYYPRHIFIISLPLIIITTAILSEIPRKIGLVILILISFMQLQLAWDIITQVSHANLALEDKFAYFENYTSGSQLSSIASTLREISGEQPLTVWLDGSYVLEYGLRREMKNDQGTFKSFRLDNNFLPNPIEVFKDQNKTTFVVTNRWEPKNIADLKLIKSFNVSFRHFQNLYLLP